jgi:hypothetical protein
MNPYENNYAKRRGFPFAVLAGFLAFVALGLGGASIYLYTEKEAAKDIVDARAGEATDLARAQQLAKDQQEFDEYVAQTTRTFESSSDFGSVKFEYPREWSVYNDKNGGRDSKTTYEAYFYPGVISPVTDKRLFAHALELRIIKGTAETIEEQYKRFIKEASVVVEDYVLVNEYTARESETGIRGQKFTGNILRPHGNETAYGTMIQFVVRDKVLQLYSMQAAHSEVFNKMILKTLRWTR